MCALLFALPTLRVAQRLPLTYAAALDSRGPTILLLSAALASASGHAISQDGVSRNALPIHFFTFVAGCGTVEDPSV
jgi:hypothetical protein